MTPNKLPPLPEPVYLAKLSKDGEWAELVPATDWTVEMWAYGTDDVYTRDQMHAYAAEALRQSQSLPAGAVADDAGQREYDQEILNNLEQLLRPRKWLGRWDEIVRQLLAEFDAIQADAREKGEAVFRLYPEELARMTHGPSLRAEEEDRLRSIYGDVAIPLYLHSGDYTEAMLLLEKQRELVENLRGQLDDAKADATDGCTEANCERCNTAIHSRGDMRHAGIGTYPATQPAQASENGNG